jgi:insertion element IS1 protein InsB
MSTDLPACRNCQSSDVVKNGRTRHDKQNYKCRDCGRQFVENPQWRMISEETKGIIDRLLLEKLPLAGIARALQISELWLQQYVNQKYLQVGREVQVRPKPKRSLRECL